jgi:ABC-type nitrate/sulfonate/bicarbonate transport system permease component
MKKDFLNWVFGLFIIIVLWQFSVSLFNPSFLPSPFIVFKSIYINKELHVLNICQTALESASGLLISSLLSIFIVLLIGAYPKFENIIYPLILIVKSTPAVTFVPIFILIIGTGVLTKIFISSLICFFPLVIGGIDGLKRTPDKFLILAESYGSNKIVTFFTFRIGYSIEGFCSGLKTAAPLSVIGAIVGEYVTGGNQAGLGAFIITNSINSVKINLYAGAVLSSFLGIIFFSISNLIYKIYDTKLHIRE